jgi:hypothetical protein
MGIKSPRHRARLGQGDNAEEGIPVGSRLGIAVALGVAGLFACYNLGFPAYAIGSHAHLTALTQPPQTLGCTPAHGRPPLIGTYGRCVSTVRVGSVTYGTDVDGPNMGYQTPPSTEYPAVWTVTHRFAERPTGWRRVLGLASPALVCVAILAAFWPRLRSRLSRDRSRRAPTAAA